MYFLREHLTGRRRIELLTALVMGGPAFILLVVFMIYPFISGFQLSQTNKRFNGAEGRNVGFDHYDRILSVALVDLPPKPEEIPTRPPPAGWYQGTDGKVIFRWRGPSLDQVGLEEYEAYQIFKQFSLGGTEYALLAKDPLFWQALQNTLYFTALVVPIQTALALVLAMMVNQRLPFMNTFRTVYFSPVVTAMVIIAVVWSFLYNPQFGLINEMLSLVSIGPFGWLQDPDWAMPAIVIMSIWQGVGFQMIIFLAGLQDISEDLYEAAEIDGAGTLQKFRFITLPMLRNTTVFVVLTTTILAFRLFDQVNVMTPDGGPEESTATIVWYAIRRGWTNGDVGYATAISIVFVMLVLAVSLVQRFFIRSESAY